MHMYVCMCIYMHVFVYEHTLEKVYFMSSSKNNNQIN